MLLFLLLLLYYITAKLKLFKLISWWYYFWYLTYIQRLEVLLKEGYQEVFKYVLLHNNKHCVIRIIAFLHLFLYPYIQLLAYSSHCGWLLMEQTWLTFRVLILLLDMKFKYKYLTVTIEMLIVG